MSAGNLHCMLTVKKDIRIPRNETRANSPNVRERRRTDSTSRACQLCLKLQRVDIVRPQRLRVGHRRAAKVVMTRVLDAKALIARLDEGQYRTNVRRGAHFDVTRA